MRTFQGRVAAITGAGSGIGRALALDLARRGCALALCDRDEPALLETVSLAGTPGVRITTACVDVADRVQIQAWADQVVRDHGGVHLLINNAGVALSAPLATVREPDFQWIMAVNFWGVVWGTQAFLPHLRATAQRESQRPGAHIVNLSSLFGLMAVPGVGPYNASKFAVRGYTEALRMELDLAGGDVSATCVHPGGIRTRIAQASRIDAEILQITGRSVDDSRAAFDRLLATTSAERAASQILGAVLRNRRRVVVGPDAKVLDLLVRMLGSWYQPVAVWLARRMRTR